MGNFPEIYEISTVIGSGTIIAYRVSAYVAREGWDKITDIVLQQLYTACQLKYEMPMETNRRPWVALTGERGLDGVRGQGYGPFRSNDFLPSDDENLKRSCRVTLIPLDAVPKVCDKPGCREWAIRTYGIQGSRPSFSVWGKVEGEEVHTCSPHALELLRSDKHYPPAISLKS